jgi:hypothetical protein
MKHKLLLLLAFAPIGLNAQVYNVFVTPQALGRGQQLQVEQNTREIRKLHRQSPDSILIDFPVSGPQRLYKVQSVSPNGKVLTNEGRSYKGKKYFGVSYRNATTAIQVSESEIVGLSDTFYIAPTQFLAQRMLESLDAVIQFKCEKAPEMIPEAARMGPSAEQLVTSTNGYIEVDFTVSNRAYTTYLLDLPTLTNRLMARLNIVFQNFAKEKVLVRVRNLIINTAPDNYDAQPSSTAKMSQHKLNNPNNTAHNAFLIDNTAGLGGVAWLGTVCSAQYATYRYGYASVQLGSTAFNTYSYDTYAITHELSHACGLHHGFWCGWTKSDGTIGAIDSTYTAEPFNGVVCFTKQKQGGPDVSFMSYNHLWTTSFPQQYGKVAGPVIQNLYNGFLSSGCIVGAQPIPTCTSFQYGPPYGPCINGQRTHTVIGSSPAGCIGGSPVLTEACVVPPTTQVTVSTNTNGKVVSGQPSYLSDGNETTRYVVQDTLILTWSNSTMLKMDTLTLISGYKPSATAAWTDFNDFTGIWVDGVRLVRSVVPAHVLRVPVGVMGKVFQIKTTGKKSGAENRKTSRVCEINLK